MRYLAYTKWFAILLFVAVVSLPALAQYPPNGGDQGQYVIVNARYGTERHNVDVTQRLRELASQDVTFRMGNSTFGIDPDPGVVKTLRIFARGPRGRTHVFEYREGSTIDGTVFSGWGGGQWGGDPWNGGWNSGDQGEYQILSARYGTPRRNVDVTDRLRQVAAQDVTFRMGNSTFGIDPDPGVVKTLRIYARGPRGETRTFEYREGSTIDGSLFSGWGGGDWGRDRWNGGWEGDGRRDDHDGDDDRHGRRDSLTIVRAIYGIGGSSRDVTGLLQSQINDGRIDMNVNNDTMGGDPAPHQRKVLSVTFTTGGRGNQRQISINEGGRLSIP